MNMPVHFDRFTRRLPILAAAFGTIMIACATTDGFAPADGGVRTSMHATVGGASTVRRLISLSAASGSTSPAIPRCRLSIDHFDRLSECAEEPWTVAIVIDFRPVGTVTGRTYLWDTLSNKSRTWDEHIKVTVAKVTGQAVGTVFEAPIACVVVVGGGHCKPSGRGFWSGQESSLDAADGASYVGDLWFTSPPPTTTWMRLEVNMNFEPPDANPVPILIGPTETIRCDSMAIFKPTKGGCVYFYAVKNILELSIRDHTVSGAARFIRTTQRLLRHHPGVIDKGPALTRLTNRSLIRRNRRVACKGLTLKRGQSCDEYPFASTYQGAAFAGPHNFGRDAVDARQNSKVGTDLGRFFLAYRIASGDPFYVSVVG